MRSRTIKVDYLARVEGEGGLYVKIKNRAVVDVKLRIFEPPRFFEAFLRGRNHSEAPDITARICGICPIAYQTSSVTAMENAFGVKVEGQLRALRRLIYCGEYIESHVLHVYLLHAPDFLGYEDAIRMAKDFPDAVKNALKLKKIGNDLMTLVGGREIHPINMKVGGFYKVPNKKELETFVEPLKWARDAALETVKLVATFDFPELEQDYEFVALRHPDEYPLFDGRLVSNKGLDIPIADFEKHFEELHVEHSTSLHCVHKEHGSYLVGPLARYALNFDKLTPSAQQAARAAKLDEVCRNPFKSIIVRSVETVYACEEALRIIKEYEKPEKPAIDIVPKAGIGCGCSEAPRGILYHRYRLDENGVILDAKIVPPTSQNQGIIESDLREFVSRNLALSNEKLTWQCEQAIRNYDPCISCSCHFLKLHIERE
ncbi:MAG: Ni/Fe hydrogenase subunit alpha [candidate division Zixibacteria bacterium]|nr:Ni/Fe hydrogenase subunit alpha [candidate division Zixibacteria bacterium]